MNRENPIKRILEEKDCDAEFLEFRESCHSVDDAAKAAGVKPEDIVKSVCLRNKEGSIVTCIVKGDDRASTKRVSKALGTETRIATPEEIFARTGFLVGGVPPFGYDAEFIIDSAIMEKDIVYGSGGSSDSLIRITPKELQRLNDARVERIRK